MTKLMEILKSNFQIFYLIHIVFIFWIWCTGSMGTADIYFLYNMTQLIIVIT